MNIAICDDEAAIRKQMSELAALEETAETIDEFATAEELLSSTKHFHLVFLDILMPGVDGVEAAKKLRAQDKAESIVFVTGVKEYVFDAFDVGALHYLLKPIDHKKFREVMDRAYEISQQYKHQQKMLVIRTRKGTETVRSCEILYAESQLKKLSIHTFDHTITYYGKISELEQQLGDTFYRCHRGYLINMSYITRYNGRSITLVNGVQIYLAKERYADFVQTYLHFLKSGGACIV